MSLPSLRAEHAFASVTIGRSRLYQLRLVASTLRPVLAAAEPLATPPGVELKRSSRRRSRPRAKTVPAPAGMEVADGIVSGQPPPPPQALGKQPPMAPQQKQGKSTPKQRKRQMDAERSSEGHQAGQQAAKQQQPVRQRSAKQRRQPPPQQPDSTPTRQVTTAGRDVKQRTVPDANKQEQPPQQHGQRSLRREVGAGPKVGQQGRRRKSLEQRQMQRVQQGQQQQQQQHGDQQKQQQPRQQKEQQHALEDEQMGRRQSAPLPCSGLGGERHPLDRTALDESLAGAETAAAAGAAQALEGVEAEGPSAGAARQRNRELQRQLLRERLEQLQQEQQAQAGQLEQAQQKPRQGKQGASESAARVRDVQGQVVRQQQPAAWGWSIEAAEVLCGLGMPPEHAAQVLLEAQSYFLQRQHQQPEAAEAEAAAAQQQHRGGQGCGETEVVTAPAAGAAAEAEGGDAGEQVTVPISAVHVEAVCRELTGTAAVPVARLQGVLAAAPQVLACSPQELRKQHGMLASVWRRPRRLAAAIQQHPGMLGPDFPTQLGRSLQELSSLGFTREQVSAAILAHPAVTRLTRVEVLAHLSGAGLDLDKSTGEVMQFLASHPQVLDPASGTEELRARLALFASWRLPPPLCPLLLARCPALLREPVEVMQGIVDILMGYGMTWSQLADVVLGYPAVLRTPPGVVRLTLKLLADFEVGLDKVVQYPRVFIHDPVNYIGPRFAYLKAYLPERLRFRLVSVLSRGDDEFAAAFCGRLEEEYAVFKASWVRQFHEQVNLPAGRSSLSRRVWGREVVDELWL